MTGTMKILFHITAGAALLLAALAFAGPTAASGKFLSVIEDLPLMDGLEEIDGGAMVFDTPAGRIVEALTIGRVDRDAVFRFYSETLPQLGWVELGPGLFSRDGELLKLEFPPIYTGSAVGGAQTGVLFLLSPEQ